MTATETTRKQDTGTTKRINVGTTPKQRKAVLLDAYIAAETKADKASKGKGTCRDNLLAICKHGEIVTATDGTKRSIYDQKDDTRQHEKVVGQLVAKYGVTEAELKKLYKDTMGSRHNRDVKKL